LKTQPKDTPSVKEGMGDAGYSKGGLGNWGIGFQFSWAKGVTGTGAGGRSRRQEQEAGAGEQKAGVSVY